MPSGIISRNPRIRQGRRAGGDNLSAASAAQEERDIRTRGALAKISWAS